MKKEIFKDIKGYEGLYQVSSYGRVRSLGRIVTFSNGSKHFYEERLLSLKKDRDGYFDCELYKKGKRIFPRVHRLVAQAFIPNPDNLPIINHKDENPSNNHVENLEWCDFKYNSNYGTAIQRRAQKRSMPVLQIDVNTGQVIAEYPSVNEVGRQTVFDFSTISKCCRGEIKTAYGYKWRYKE